MSILQEPVQWRSKIVCPYCSRYDFPNDWIRLNDSMTLACPTCVQTGLVKMCKKCKKCYARECACSPRVDEVGSLVTRHHQHSQEREPFFLKSQNEILLGIELELSFPPSPNKELFGHLERFPGVERVWDGTINNRQGIEYTFPPMSLDWIKANYDRFEFLNLIHKEVPRCKLDRTASTHINVERKLLTDEQVAYLLYNFYSNPADNMLAGGGKSLYNMKRWAKFLHYYDKITMEDALYVATYANGGKGKAKRQLSTMFYNDVYGSKYSALHLKQFALEYRAMIPVVCFADFKKRIEYVESQIYNAI